MYHSFKQHWQRGGLIATAAYVLHLSLHVVMPLTAAVEAALVICFCAYCRYIRRNRSGGE